ncbi:glycosyltransferase family 2 protein [Gramella sp. GC03-9]|uniref:Glycosyltransferase family 2 protein n=1 Tax=Christiangramia oceanisediminis TaxID=2920386 RepID=A0A9X2I2V1_9FLAO|nr:glycosyltransferase family 2 protein [Gramella oceanisediminis]MCP9198317.1 glycosyltransferase family 2 protein [Gramella oceanisediminis]
MITQKIIIVIVTYNGMPWIDKCLRSSSNFKVIVVDNCSSDGTSDHIKSNYPDVELIQQQKNLGFGAANNIGISKALREGADFVFLLNQDAYLEEGVLEKMIDVAKKNPEYGVLSPIHLKGNGRGLEPVFSYYLHKENDNGLFSDLILQKSTKDIYDISMVNAAAWLIPRKTFETIGGFQPLFFLYGEDDNYCQRVWYHGFKVGVVVNCFIRHDSNNNYHIYPVKGTKKYYEKFLNRIKVDYADVNSERYKRVKNLGSFYFKKAIVSLFQNDFESFKANLKKREIVNGLDFAKQIEKDRAKGMHYL